MSSEKNHQETPPALEQPSYGAPQGSDGAPPAPYGAPPAPYGTPGASYGAPPAPYGAPPAPYGAPPAPYGAPPAPYGAPPAPYKDPTSDSKNGFNDIVIQPGNAMTTHEPYADVPDYFVLSIISIFFCTCIGLISIIKASKARELKASGRYQSALAEASTAKQTAILAIFLGIILTVVYISMQIFAITF
ncbi:hypothetical protein RRG08_052260 [Elysia crispata]|uniref:Interferon-induced transmembrane protein n=1 Tax=Elysia crispata TaxID=231223 RepID=A0AAE1DPQ2_9GAST|nr:hypothetical protein RRG08_052260 [Elysia crispata]